MNADLVDPNSPLIDPVSSYSTILQCTQDAFTCTLRLFEGVISLIMFIVFLKGYRVLSSENNNPLSKEDKRIYLLAMAQTFILTLYYFLFEQFFILATIRSLLIWIGINVLQNLFYIYWIEDEATYKKSKKVIYLLKIINFLMWFVIAVVDGSAIVNTSFNLGYNCLILDWVVLSSVLFAITLLQAFVAFQIIHRLDWQFKQEFIQNDKMKQQSITEQKMDIILLVGGAMGGAFIMFIWDYLAYMIATNDHMCMEIFSGNTFFRKLLCFLLKIISMQVVPTIVYFTLFFKKRNQFIANQQHREVSFIDYFDDDPSVCNYTLSERTNSRKSLLSGIGSTPNL